MNSKFFKPKEVANPKFDIRWTNDDIEAGLPEKFLQACKQTGRSRSDALRMFVIEFISVVEKAGGSIEIKQAASRVIEEK